MDQIYSELPGIDPVADTLQLIRKVLQAVKLNPQLAAGVLKQNPPLRIECERVLASFETAKQAPRQTIRTVVDNPALDFMEIDPIIPNDVHEPNIEESDCSAVVLPPMEAARSEERRVGKERRSRWSPY